MRSANASTLPADTIASATAASFPDRSISPYRSSRTVMRSPAFKYRLEPSTPAASGGTETSRSKSPASQTRSPVMIFVVLAMRLRSSAFFSNSTRPEPASTKIALFALTLPGNSAARVLPAQRKTAATTAAAVLI